MDNLEKFTYSDLEHNIGKQVIYLSDNGYKRGVLYRKRFDTLSNRVFILLTEMGEDPINLRSNKLYYDEKETSEGYTHLYDHYYYKETFELLMKLLKDYEKTKDTATRDKFYDLYNEYKDYTFDKEVPYIIEGEDEDTIYDMGYVEDGVTRVEKLLREVITFYEGYLKEIREYLMNSEGYNYNQQFCELIEHDVSGKIKGEVRVGIGENLYRTKEPTFTIRVKIEGTKDEIEKMYGIEGRYKLFLDEIYMKNKIESKIDSKTRFKKGSRLSGTGYPLEIYSRKITDPNVIEERKRRRKEPTKLEVELVKTINVNRECTRMSQGEQISEDLIEIVEILGGLK